MIEIGDPATSGQMLPIKQLNEWHVIILNKYLPGCDAHRQVESTCGEAALESARSFTRNVEQRARTRFKLTADDKEHLLQPAGWSADKSLGATPLRPRRRPPTSIFKLHK